MRVCVFCFALCGRKIRRSMSMGSLWRIRKLRAPAVKLALAAWLATGVHDASAGAPETLPDFASGFGAYTLERLYRGGLYDDAIALAQDRLSVPANSTDPAVQSSIGVTLLLARIDERVGRQGRHPVALAADIRALRLAVRGPETVLPSLALVRVKVPRVMGWVSEELAPGRPQPLSTAGPSERLMEAAEPAVVTGRSAPPALPSIEVLEPVPQPPLPSSSTETSSKPRVTAAPRPARRSPAVKAAAKVQPKPVPPAEGYEGWALKALQK